jgi:hypothetical protein
MSARRVKPNTKDTEIAQLRRELEDIKNHTRALDAADVSVDGNTRSHEFDQLSSVEQSAASLGVAPDSWKPISFLNARHYEQLIQANMLDDTLARRIEVSARCP